jgi:NitT/TauT family transport system permease protein
MSATAITLILSSLVTASAIVMFCSRHSVAELTALDVRRLRLWEKAFLFVGGIALFTAIWSLASWLKPTGVTRIPSPLMTLRTAYEMLASGVLINEAGISFVRVLVGFTLASIIGVAGGLLAGSFSLLNRLLVPGNSFLRYIPPTAFVALMIVYFGIGEAYKYAVVFVGVVFFIFQMTVDVVEDLDVRYVEMGLTGGLTRFEVFRKIYIPASWPRIVDVLRINLSGAWTFLVAAEIVGAETGLGHLVAISQRFLRIEELYVAILMFGLIGLTTDWVIQLLSRRLLRWHTIQVSR